MHFFDSSGSFSFVLRILRARSRIRNTTVTKTLQKKRRVALAEAVCCTQIERAKVGVERLVEELVIRRKEMELRKSAVFRASILWEECAGEDVEEHVGEPAREGNVRGF